MVPDVCSLEWKCIIAHRSCISQPVIISSVQRPSQLMTCLRRPAVHPGFVDCQATQNAVLVGCMRLSFGHQNSDRNSSRGYGIVFFAISAMQQTNFSHITADVLLQSSMKTNDYYQWEPSSIHWPNDRQSFDSESFKLSTGIVGL